MWTYVKESNDITSTWAATHFDDLNVEAMQTQVSHDDE